MKSYNRKETK